MKKVVITSADNMSQEVYYGICKGFCEKYGEEFEFSHVIDNSIIGGFIAETDGKIYDLSISSQLREMKKQVEK